MTSYESLYDRYMRESNYFAAQYGIEPSTAHNGAWDAFRHAYKSGAMTREYGEYSAKTFGDLNEIRGDITHAQPFMEKNMDWWNNSVGRSIGKDSKTNDEVARRVYEALKRGDLITDPLNDARHYDDANRPGEKNLMDQLKKQFDAATKAISPLVLDLDGDGVETLGQSSGIHFDHDGNRFAQKTGWVGKDDGLLVLDRNGNGKIDSGAELFGNQTLLKVGAKAGQKAANGFEALRELDVNQDGVIDAKDAAYAQLKVWRDGNSNGVTEAGELLTLAAAKVGSIKVAYSAGNAVDAQGNQHLQLGSYTGTDGKTRSMTDVWFSQDTARTVDLDTVAVSAEIAKLPDLQGFGNFRRRFSLPKSLHTLTSQRFNNPPEKP